MMETIQELRAKVQSKGLPGDPYLQRWPSAYLTYVLVRTPVSPNQVTAAMFCAGIAAAVAVFFGWFWLGFFFIYLNLILDMCDGEVARYKQVRTFDGGYLDHVQHLLVQPLFFLALTYQAAGLPARVDVLVLIIGVVGALLMSVRRTNTELARALFVRKYMKHPELFAEEARALPVEEKWNPGGMVSSSSWLHTIALLLYETHELMYLLLILIAGYGIERYVGAAGHPVLYWLVMYYGVTTFLYFVREIYGSFTTADARIRFFARQVFSKYPR